MTNHIQQILDDLADTSDIAPSHCWKRLTIRAICALAFEVRYTGNVIDGVVEEGVPSQPLAEDFDRESSNVAGWVHGCTMKDGVVDCLNCPGLPTCVYTDRRAIERAQAEAANREVSEVSAELHDCTQTEARASCLDCTDAEGCVHMAQEDK